MLFKLMKSCDIMGGRQGPSGGTGGVALLDVRAIFWADHTNARTVTLPARYSLLQWEAATQSRNVNILQQE